MNITPTEEGWIRENIEKIDFLAHLQAHQVDTLVRHVEPRILAGNQTLIMEGDPGSSFFLIYTGRISIWVERQAQRAKLATLQKGDYFGEISLLTGKPATAQVVANTPSKVFFLRGDLFIEMVRDNPLLAEKIVTVMKSRLEKRRSIIQALTEKKIEDIQNAIQEFLKPEGNSPA